MPPERACGNTWRIPRQLKTPTKGFWKSSKWNRCCFALTFPNSSAIWCKTDYCTLNLQMWARLRRYKALDAESRALFWRAVLLLPRVALSLRFRGYARPEAALNRRPIARPDSALTQPEYAL